jgi:hypothetical protein
MKKGLLCFLVLLMAWVFSQNLAAQTYFTDTSTHQSVASLSQSLLVDNDSTIYLGALYGQTQPVLRPVSMLVNRTNSQTNWINVFGRRDANNYVTDLKRWDESYLLLTGEYVSGAHGSQSVVSTYVFVVDSQGDSIWYKEYTSGQSDVTLAARAIARMGNEIWVATSRRVVTSNNVLDRKICLLRLDSLGNEIDRYIYGLSNMEETVLTLTLFDNNELIVGGSRVNKSIGLNRTTQTWIFAVDTGGQVRWEYLSPINLRLTDPGRIIVDNDGGITFSASRVYTYPLPNGLTYDLTRGYMAQLNSSHVLVWDTTCGIESNTTGFYRVAAANGGYVAVGNHFDNSQDGNIQGWMVKFDNSGNILWQRFFDAFPGLQDYQFSYLQYVSVTELGNIVAAGRGENYTAALDHGQYAWIIKTDSLGCLVPGCALSLGELTTEPVYLKVYPNPATDVLNVLLKSEQRLPGAVFKLTDMLGRTRHSWKAGPEDIQYQISLADFEPGMYVLQLWENGRLRAWERVIRL